MENVEKMSFHLDDINLPFTEMFWEHESEFSEMFWEHESEFRGIVRNIHLSRDFVKQVFDSLSMMSSNYVCIYEMTRDAVCIIDSNQFKIEKHPRS